MDLILICLYFCWVCYHSQNIYIYYCLVNVYHVLLFDQYGIFIMDLIHPKPEQYLILLVLYVIICSRHKTILIIYSILVTLITVADLVNSFNKWKTCYHMWIKCNVSS